MSKGTKQRVLVDAEARTVSVEYPALGKKVVVRYDDIPRETQIRAALHGLAQKLGDAESGNDAGAKYAAATEIAEALRRGEWNRSGGTGGGSFGGFSRDEVITAIASVTKRPAEAIAKLPDDKLRELSRHPKVKEAALTARAKRAAEEAKAAAPLAIDL